MQLIKKIVVGSLLAFSASAHAVVIEQSPSNGGDGVLSVKDFGAQLAESFQFSSDVALNDISWWGSYFTGPQPTELFTVRIFADDAGDPAITPLFETTFSGNGDDSEGMLDLFGGTVYRYDISLGAPVMLSGGVDYYLSVVNNDSNDDWYWLESSGGDNWARVFDGEAWFYDASSLDLSYRLDADIVEVPETPTWLLMSMPLLLLVRRFARNQ